jgi:hypothetical protein
MAQDPTQSNFISDTAAEVGPPAQVANAPKVPFQSSLVLTGEQEQKMIDHAFSRMNGISNELGRDQTLQPTWWANLAPAPNLQSAAQGFLQASTFLGKRSRFDATFMNDVSWRPWTMGVDNIFMSSNIVVPLSRRITRQMIARAKKSFFGSDPYISVEPTPGTGDQLEDDQAERIERYCRFKFKEANSKGRMGRAIAQALILGECAVKTTYMVRDQIFDAEAEVLTDAETGEAIKDNNGGSITQDDQWKDAEDGLGTQVLARDGITQKPEAPLFTKQALNRRQVLFQGAISEPIYFKDFLCPLTATDVQTADCVCHIYDKQIMEFVDLAVKRGMVDNSEEGRDEATKKMVALIQAMDSNTAQPKAAVNMAIRPNENFTPMPSTAGESSGPIAEIVEFYLWHDANGDGIAENICLICDRKSRQPIFYDHVANVTTDGLRPIEIVRINGIEGRWYGLGIVELFESYQTIVDLMVNRWNFSNSRAGSVHLWNPKNTLEGDRDPSLKMNFGMTYTKKPGVKAEDVIEVVYLNDTKFEQFKELVEFFMQLAMNESGVTNANDGQAAGMASSKLATGIMQIEQSGDELFAPIIEDLAEPLQNIACREVDIILANLDADEAFSYLNGDTAEIDHITPDDVRGLKFRATIELTTHKNQQILQLSAQAIALVKDFYLNTPPQVQPMVIGMYRDQLRILAPKCNPEDVLKIMPMPPMAPPGAPGAPSADSGMQPPPPPTMAKAGAPSAKSPATSAANGGLPAQHTQTTREPVGRQTEGSSQAA